MTDESVNVTSGERDAKYRYAYEAEAERLMGTWTREQLLVSFFPEFDSGLIWTKEQLLAIISDTETGWLTNVETDALERFTGWTFKPDRRLVCASQYLHGNVLRVIMGSSRSV